MPYFALRARPIPKVCSLGALSGKPADLRPVALRPWLRAVSSRTPQSTVSAQDVPSTPGKQVSLALPSQARHNEIGVQQLSSHIYQQIFPDGGNPAPPELVELAKEHLRRHELLGKITDTTGPIAFDLPPLHGRTLDEHFHRLGLECAEPYLSNAKTFASSDLPPTPTSWARTSGWTKYSNDGRTESVDAPDEDVLCFDTEVLWKKSPFAVMACAASATAWYVWLSPWLLGESDSMRHLIPIGNPARRRVIVGHNIGYDRARIREEYSIKPTMNFFLDTMSLHVAVNGMCSQQRPTWMKYKKKRELQDEESREDGDPTVGEFFGDPSRDQDEDEPWVTRSSANSLKEVARFHLGQNLNKEIRNDFGELDRAGVCGKLDELLAYCASDVSTTHAVYRIVFPNFLQVCPHPVSFGALRHLSSVILPVNRSWDRYIANTEAIYQKLCDAVQERLVTLAERALEIKGEKEKWSIDPWLRQLDWSGQEVRMVKGKLKNDPPRPSTRQKMPGMPKWYRDLFTTTDSAINLTLRSRLAPLLLRLAWDGYPLVWSEKYGWTCRVPVAEANAFGEHMLRCDVSEEPNLTLRDDLEAVYFKLPHKDGPLARCANPMAKGYLVHFENGTLSSEYPYAKEALAMNASCSYWMSARDRIMSQMVVYQSDLCHPADSASDAADNPAGDEPGFILPQIIPMGTITRRAVENTWLTASNAKKNRVGSELKAMVKAPPGYSFVGADVDSEELWIASLVGDAVFKLHGGNALGFMTLEGTKAAGTDLHSRTAGILGITRNDAKVFNYGRIYGAGLKFAATLLRQFNPSLPEKASVETASRLYIRTKGAKASRKAIHNRPFWRGGTESYVFNKLEQFAEQERPRTPVLGAGITEALMGKFINKGGYLTSRINWAIQSSGVDYLHLLIVSMQYLTRRFNIDARLAITVHDEIRYLVRDQDRYRAAMALQVANLWTRAMFAQQVGINDLPQTCAFFSAVDIDRVLRKEVDMDCVTPSHPHPIPFGDSVDIVALLNKGSAARLDPAIVPELGSEPRLDGIVYQPRVPIMETLQGAGKDKIVFLRAQMVSKESELRELLRTQRKISIQDVLRETQRPSAHNSANTEPVHQDASTAPTFAEPINREPAVAKSESFEPFPHERAAISESIPFASHSVLKSSDTWFETQEVGEVGYNLATINFEVLPPIPGTGTHPSPYLPPVGQVHWRQNASIISQPGPLFHVPDLPLPLQPTKHAGKTLRQALSGLHSSQLASRVHSLDQARLFGAREQIRAGGWG